MGKKNDKEEQEKFTKPDMDRMGIFKELGYISIGDKYRDPSGKPFNESACKGKQMMIGGIKSKNATADGYFDKQFARILEGEAYKHPTKLVKPAVPPQGENAPNKDAKKGPFVPSNGEKKPSGLGSYYGCLSGPLDAMSPAVKSKVEKESGKSSKKNNNNKTPAKVWSCGGHPGDSFNKYHPHMADDYDAYKEDYKKELEKHKSLMKGDAFKTNPAPKVYFDENPFKSDVATQPSTVDAKPQQNFFQQSPFIPSNPPKVDGGMKAGCFDRFPPHFVSSASSSKKEDDSIKGNKQQPKIRTFHTSSAPKSTPVASIVQLNVDKTINTQNFRSLQSVMSF